ncbi:hypothetical protein HKCCE2091_16610 [Rhodobacterales bacterium HKCCE2091]|nr:hypothetical protein [Rhodobacterales bacterium HKCCE2091]
MSGQSRKIQAILTERLRTTQEIAAANVEHLRLSQIAGGLMILDMKAERDADEDARDDAERVRNFCALEDCMERIQDLEGELSKLDEELEAATKGTEE